MQNIFPIAQRAAIEETIGMKRPSAIAPPHQSVKVSVAHTSVAPANAPCSYAKPAWFAADGITERERNMLQSIARENPAYGCGAVQSLEEEYLALRGQIIREAEGGYVPLQFVMRTSNYRLATVAYNFLEDSKAINYNTDLLDVIGSLYDSHNNNGHNASEHFGNGRSNNASEHNSTASNNINNSAICVEKESKNVREKYFKRELLEKALCTCGTPAMYFTSDLLFICEGCFTQERFPPTYRCKNFHRLTPELLGCLWTREEEYLLLSNIEKFGDAWARVTEGLNKTYEQCIFHFIKLSIIDDVSRFPPVPFTQVPNTVSTLVAFVCSLVYPSIATELSKTALQHISSPDLMAILLRTAQAKGIEVLGLEKAKRAKLEKVETEALVKRILLKVDSISEMHAEIQAVKSELEDERERLLEDFTRAK